VGQQVRKPPGGRSGFQPPGFRFLDSFESSPLRKLLPSLAFSRGDLSRGVGAAIREPQDLPSLGSMSHPGMDRRTRHHRDHLRSIRSTKQRSVCRACRC